MTSDPLCYFVTPASWRAPAGLANNVILAGNGRSDKARYDHLPSDEIVQRNEQCTRLHQHRRVRVHGTRFKREARNLDVHLGVDLTTYHHGHNGSLAAFADGELL